MFSRINLGPTSEGGGGTLPARPVAQGPLLQEVLKLPDGPGVVERLFGRIALGVIKEGGTLTIQSSEEGPSYVEVQIRGQTIKLQPVVGGDPEEETLIQMRGREISSHKDVAADVVQLALENLRIVMHRESQRRK